MCKLLLGLAHHLLRPKGTASRYISPFARDIVLFDVRSNCVDVLHFKRSDLSATIKKKWLTVSAILKGPDQRFVFPATPAHKTECCSESRIAPKHIEASMKTSQLTLPVAPQHASLASRSTILLPLALLSSAKYLAADVPVMPLPTMTISASAGSSSVVRCPIKNLLGSLCQNELLEVGVGSVARSCFMMR